MTLRSIGVLGVVALVAAGAIIFALRDRPPPARSDSPQGEVDPTEEASPAESQPPAKAGPERGTLLYLKGRTVHGLDLKTGSESVVASMPTKDVWASPAGPWLAYVVPGEPLAETDPDFIPDPILRVTNFESGDDARLGPGFQPVWHPAEERVAYLRPVEDRECSGETCPGFEELVVYDLATDEETVLNDPGDYSILGWAGNRVLFSDESDLSKTYGADANGPESLPIAPSEVWGASSDGEWLLTGLGSAAKFVSLDSGESSNAPLPGLLLDAVWSTIDNRVATVTLPRRGEPEVHVVRPDGDEKWIFEPQGETAMLSWTQSGEVVVPTRRAARILEILVCADRSCDSAGRLRGATLLLGVTPG